MKHIFLAGAVALATAMPASAALFTVDLANSSVDLVETGGAGAATITAELNSGLGSTSFNLDNPGESETFSFIDFGVDCGGAFFCSSAKSYDITATLALDPPGISATGVGDVVGGITLFGSIIAGILTWDQVPVQVGFGLGGLATIDFEGGVALLAGPSVTTDATVTLDVAPVPLPAAGILLLGALGGLSVVRRRAKAA